MHYFQCLKCDLFGLVKIFLWLLEAQKKVVWIVSDARRPTDVEYFVNRYGRNEVFLIRVEASTQVRVERGFKFQPGIDDADSECALDSFTEWDLVFHNNGSEEFHESFEILKNMINSKLGD